MTDVLVVDDDFMVTQINSGFVDKVDGFRVTGTAATGAQALDRARELQPDLVLLDLYLPDLFGLDVLTRLRAEACDCDVLVVTAARELDAVRRANRQGVSGYLLKPFDFDDLRTRLERYAARRAELGRAVIRSQADVDRLLAGGSAPPPTLPKGMSVETAELVRRLLRTAATPLSAAECAERLGASRVTARRYLEYFATTGQATVSLRYGTAGRPQRRYHWHRTT